MKAEQSFNVAIHAKTLLLIPNDLGLSGCLREECTWRTKIPLFEDFKKVISALGDGRLVAEILITGRGARWRISSLGALHELLDRKGDISPDEMHKFGGRGVLASRIENSWGKRRLVHDLWF